MDLGPLETRRTCVSHGDLVTAVTHGQAVRGVRVRRQTFLRDTGPPLRRRRGQRPLFETARREIPEGWDAARIGDWQTLTPLDADGSPLPGSAQGWKIHASATRANADRIAAIVWDYCVPRRIPFKFVPAGICCACATPSTRAATPAASSSPSTRTASNGSTRCCASSAHCWRVSRGRTSRGVSGASGRRRAGRVRRAAGCRRCPRSPGPPRRRPVARTGRTRARRARGCRRPPGRVPGAATPPGPIVPDARRGPEAAGSLPPLQLAVRRFHGG
jgi:hypothetical protein